MTSRIATSFCLFALVAGCVETTSVTSVADDSSSATAVAEAACMARLASTANAPLSSIRVTEVLTAEAGIGVTMSLAGATAPWSCLSDARGNVQGLTFTGSEGAL
jgi:hypothetical protein